MSVHDDLPAESLTVLIPVYAGAHADDFSDTLDSLWAQTQRADAVLIVEDGPLTPALDSVIAEHKLSHPELRTLRLSRNQGAGPALQAGLGSIDTVFVARLDADDLAAPKRFEKQLHYFRTHSKVDVVGTAVMEFDDSIYHSTRSIEEAATQCRVLPTTHDDIVRYLRINTPVNHPSIMARTAAIRSVGGYQSVHHMEDYDLWARMIAAGYRFINLPEPLTYFRTSNAQIGRRTGKGMFTAERHMQRNLVRYGLISKPRAAVNLVIRTVYRALPTGLLLRVYSKLFYR